ncbi:MAG: PAS domain S-box protein [Desulfovibrionaceae bacterium]
MRHIVGGSFLAGLLVVLLGGLLLAAELYSQHLGERIGGYYAPLMDASMELRQELASGHLWLEELLAGDAVVPYARIRGHLDEAVWYARAMLQGGSNAKGAYLPLRSREHVLQAQRILGQLLALRDLAEDRYRLRQDPKTPGVGPESDAEFDALALAVMARAERLEAGLQADFTDDLARFRANQRRLLAAEVAGIVLASCLVVLAVLRLERGRRRALQSEQRLGVTLDSIGDGVIVTDAAGRVTRLNPVAETLTGWSQAEALGRPMREVFVIINAVTRKAQESPVERVLAEGVVVGLANHTILVARDGDERQIADSGAPIRGGDGSVAGVVMVFRDVTDQYRRDQLLARSESLLRVLVERAPLGIFSSSPEGRYLQANDELARIYGFASSRDLLENVDDIAGQIYMDPGDRARLLTMLRDRGEVRQFESLRRRKDGSGVWTSLNIREVRDGMGRPVRLEGYVTDITQRKQAEAALNQAMERVTAANQAKTAFLAGMSHEIRTPLGGVMGMLQLLGATRLDAEQQDYADKALASVRSLQTLLSDILDLSRVEAGRLDLVDASFSLKDLFATVLDTFGPMARDKGLTLDLDFGPGLPGHVVADQGRVRQVLFNLVGNAVKYTDQGGVRVSVWALSSSTPERVRLVVLVSDSGVGIRPERLAEMFQPFVQVDGSARRRAQGAGLGLAIVHRLLRLLGGTLCLDTEAGRGSDFYVRLDLKADLRPAVRQPGEPETVRPRPGDATAARRPLHVLLAEDDRVNRLAVTRFLEKLGHTVTAVEDGAAALAALERAHYDCVLMDVQMPVLDGVEATRRIRRHQDGRFDPVVPIVALTAHAMDGDRERLLAEGMNAYLAKPVDFAELRAVLDRLG